MVFLNKKLLVPILISIKIYLYVIPCKKRKNPKEQIELIRNLSPNPKGLHRTNQEQRACPRRVIVEDIYDNWPRRSLVTEYFPAALYWMREKSGPIPLKNEYRESRLPIDIHTTHSSHRSHHSPFGLQVMPRSSHYASRRILLAPLRPPGFEHAYCSWFVRCRPLVFWLQFRIESM